MKKFILILSVFLASSNVISYGASVEDILHKYGMAEKTIDIGSLKIEYSNKIKSFNQLTDNYYTSQYLSNINEMVKYTRESKLNVLNIDKCILELQRLNDCLEAMVQVDASLEEIFDIEEQYRIKRNELNEKILCQKIYNNSTSFEIIENQISYDDIKIMEEELKKLKNEISEVLNQEDIGEIKNLKIPTKGYYNISSKFGNRTNPITGKSIENHSGLDLAAPKNTEVMALFKGTVAVARYSNSLGNYIILEYGNGLQTLYGHMDSLNVKEGQNVEQYETIGFVGTTGSSTGNHLHLGVYINGVKMNPETLFKE